MMKGIFFGIVFALFVIMTFEVALSKEEDDPSSEDAAEKEEMNGALDTKCFVCKARGRRRIRKNSALRNCLHLDGASESVDKVVCQHGCMAAYGVFKNHEESIERWCVNGDQLEQELIDLYHVVKTRRVNGEKEGSTYSCDTVYFDDGKDGKGKDNSSEKISRDPLSYNFCWCRGNECNGRQINSFIRAGASGRVGGGGEGESGRMMMTFVFALIFGLFWIPGSLGDKIKCNFCTEKTHSDCFEGGKDINIQLCDPAVHYTNSCIKMQTCVSGLPCEIYRGCQYKTVKYCLGVADVEVTDHECNKRRFELNTPWGSTAFICLHSLKAYYEKKGWEEKGKTLIKPSSDFDDEDELKATRADVAVVEVEYCHCNSDNCNGGSVVKGSLGLLLGLVGFLALKGGRHAGNLMALMIMLGTLTMVSCQSTNTTNTNGTTGNITFDCFKCSDSKTSCFYTYLEECPDIDISNKDTLKNTKYQDKTCGKGNDTRLCKALTTQHVLGGGPVETEKGCLDPKELQCFEETFQVNVTEGGCAEKSMGYEEYTKWLRCNVKSKVKITTNYNDGVVKIMEEMKDFYGEEGATNEFFVKLCTCNADGDSSKGCNYNLK